MAFMMPVMKNNFDIYKDTSRSRKTSECSEPGSLSSRGGAQTLPHSASGRVRKVSECKSESYATSPTHNYRMQLQRCQSSRTFIRNGSRTSHSSAMSPTRSFCQASSPPKNNNTAASTAPENHNDITKFHLRLVEKLRKSFRKDSAKRS